MIQDQRGIPIVIDSGSFMCKAGIAGNKAPSSVFLQVVGQRNCCDILFGTRYDYIGEEAWVKKGVLRLTYPIERGIIQNWDNFQKIMHHCLHNELRKSPQEHPVLLTEGTS